MVFPLPPPVELVPPLMNLLAAQEVNGLTETLLGQGMALATLSVVLLIMVLTGFFGQSGFTRSEVLLLLLAGVAGSIVPATWTDFSLVKIDDVTVAASALGMGIPALISGKVALSSRLRPSEALVGLMVTAFVAYEVSTFDPSRGIIVEHFTLVPLIGALLAVTVKGALDRGSPPLAYFYGSMGVLVGADLLHMPQLIQESSGITTVIGGAGISDAVFLAGAVAVAMDAIIDYYREERERDTDIPGDSLTPKAPGTGG